jgi:hypothetical protein
VLNYFFTTNLFFEEIFLWIFILRPPHKQKKKGKEKMQKKKSIGRIYIYIYIYIYKKSISKCPKNYQRLIIKDQIYKIKKFNSIFFTEKGSISKENLI